MRIRVWNAYASNNSGSYTIVGWLPSAEVAESAADALRAVIDAHTAWRKTWDGKSTEGSPLAEFCRKHGLDWAPDRGGWGDWPEYSPDSRPQLVVAGRQIVIHHAYTVSLPPTFGEFFYKRGGRVLHEEDHAHHPLVLIAKFWDGGSAAEHKGAPVDFARLVAEVTSGLEIVARQNVLDCPSAWRTGDGFGEPPLTVGVIAEDVIEDVTTLRALAERHGASFQVSLAEAAPSGDALHVLRPSTPTVPRFDLHLLDPGPTPGHIAHTLAEAVKGEVSEKEVLAKLLGPPPIPVARSLFESRARSLASKLEGQGAQVELHRNDA